ncbi:PEGA domain-containing protein [Flavobacterium fluvii]|uniref:PEGA domain-containing protein n=1 Tax=Flavobacterium fluvii TaxID=468056 RepID=A0A1M5M852_9FLAO|nr:PEGA domain-containing protein [Flavobacterium fluvii]SHG73494.1 PEGA domain-containing protein [Flavobacterium fluvii]
MKKLILFTFLMLSSSMMLGQNAYIQVSGEPDLSVFLNNKFKAKTTAEIGGCVIENVTPGKNLIKVVKEGYIPFEETITIKKGEVFSYKVRPFSKNTVSISENGNSGETEKKASIETGKLVIQSLPINIKITIPSIEGVTNSQKTKDEWVVDNIASGSRDVTFIFNKKIIKKSFEIIGGETTNVFINMMNGEYKTRNTIDEKIKVTNFIDSLSTVYKFEARLKKEDFKNYNPEVANYYNKKSTGIIAGGLAALGSKTPKGNAPKQIVFDKNGELIKYEYSIGINKNNKSEVVDYYNKIVEQIKNFPEPNKTITPAATTVVDADTKIKFSLGTKELLVLFEPVEIK